MALTALLNRHWVHNLSQSQYLSKPATVPNITIFSVSCPTSLLRQERFQKDLSLIYKIFLQQPIAVVILNMNSRTLRLHHPLYSNARGVAPVMYAEAEKIIFICRAATETLQSCRRCSSSIRHNARNHFSPSSNTSMWDMGVLQSVTSMASLWFDDKSSKLSKVR